MTGLRAFPLRTIAWALLAMSRPSQLVLVLVVYGLGAAIALAGGSARSDVALALGAIALVPVAASVHYANEYADHGTDALTTRTPFSGGSGALPRTGLPRRLAGDAAVATGLLGGAIALAAWGVGLPIAAIGLLFAGAVLGWEYSLGPLRLGWRGWGELDNAVAGGLVLPAYGYAVLSGRVDASVFLACLPFFLLVFLNLLDTTWPDRAADAAVGKRTLATRWPVTRLRGAYLAGTVGWALALATLTGQVLPLPVGASGLLALPFVLWGAACYTRTASPFPSVAAMVLTAVVQLAAWLWIARG